MFANWLPLLVVATYVLAPLPNAVCSRYAAGEDFMSDPAGYRLPPRPPPPVTRLIMFRGAFHDLGKFITGFLVVTGIGISCQCDADVALPIALYHSDLIALGAAIMSILGGFLIYGTITVYSHFFSTVTEEF